MTTKNYLHIQSNIVTNIIVWDGNESTWKPPVDSLMLIQEETPALIWTLNTSVSPSVYELSEVIGAGEIGFTWDGTFLMTNQPKPEFIIKPLLENTQTPDTNTLTKKD